ncbi:MULTISPECIES: hypothetical protein [unclassified Streptomyces]|uniref:hypothetical protein n=1 Tax=unclassified Streptomyces TaxID=2593676 RepID=UPI001CD2F2E5|nr:MULTISPECIES: hypothetical protein [unclassified Streptomyces]
MSMQNSAWFVNLIRGASRHQGIRKVFSELARHSLNEHDRFRVSPGEHGRPGLRTPGARLSGRLHLTP